MRRPLVIAAVVVGVLILAAAALAGPGDLDPGFGTGGSTLTALGSGASVGGLARRLGGGFVVAGSPQSTGLSLVAYTAAGALDTTFNGTGTVTTPVGDSSAARSVVVQGDGKIVVAGDSQLGAQQRLVVARYTTAGALDPTFGAAGIAVFPVSIETINPRGLAIASDGKIVIAATETSSTVTERGFVARLTTAGALDTSFNPSGMTPGERELTVGSDTKTSLFGLALDGTDRPVIAGSASDGGVRKALILRLTTAGANDATFGALATPGATLTNFGALSEFDDVTLDGSGRPVAAGAAASQAIVARYTTAGATDTSFDTDGVQQVAAGSSAAATGIALDSGGRIVIAGRGTTGTGHDATLVARLTTAGAVDPAFTHGANLTGAALVSLGDGNSSTAADLAVGPDDLPVTAGTALDSSQAKVAIARFGGTNQSPTAHFTFTPATPRQNQTVTFDGTSSSDPDGTIAGYQWDFDGGGFDATGPAPTHVFATAGNNAVTLRVTDNRGTTADFTTNVPVTLNQPPTAAFSVTPSPVLRGVTETLDGSASADSDGSVATYQWDFTDDGTFDTSPSASATVTHAYPALGSTRARLRVTDNEGKTTDATQTFTVANRPPIAAFTASLTGKVASFDASTTTDPDGTITSYRWDFDNDGFVDATTSMPTTTHPYASPGAVIARLTVVDSDSATDTTTRSLTVAGAAPTAQITATPATVQPKYDVKSFSAAGSSDPDGTIASYKWDLDGDGTYETTTGGPSAAKTYAAPGPVTVSLKVVDDDGLESPPVTAGFNVSNQAPHAFFTQPSATQETTDPVQFDASGSNDPDGDHVIRRYEWDYQGNGTFVDGPVKPTHVYAKGGQFHPVLRVTDEFGATTTFTGPPLNVASKARIALNATTGTDFALRPGGTATGYFQLIREFGSSGDVKYKLDGLPAGVTAQLSQVTGNADFQFLRLTATPGAQPSSTVVTLTATPVNESGTGFPVSLKLSVNVTVTVDVRARSIDVTQGTQTLDALPIEGPGDYSGDYAGVRLVAGKQTVVRVLADETPDLKTGVKGAYVTLSATRKGQSLGAPITALQDPALLHASGTIADPRTSPDDISTFVLPVGWTSGSVELTAHVTLPHTNTIDLCPDVVCKLDDDYTLKGVNFETAKPSVIRPLQVTWTRPKAGGGIEDGTVHAADKVFADAKDVSPVADADNQVLPYIGTVDATDVARLPQHLVPDVPENDGFFDLSDLKCNLQPDQCHDLNADGQDVKNGLVADRVDLWLKDNDALGTGKVNVGDNTIAVNRVLARGISFPSYTLGGKPHPLAVVDENRPLTSVAHELFHDFGRVHASKACNGDGDDWQPDQWGYLDGIGFDVRAPLDAASFKLAPNPVTNNSDAGPTGGAGVFDQHQEFDFMSYCARTSDDDSWIAPLGWNRTLDLRRGYIVKRSARAAAGTTSLFVNGFVTRDGGAAIDQTALLPGGPDATASAPLSVVLRGAGGAPVSAPIATTITHTDPGGPIMLFAGSVPLPADGTVASLTLVHDGTAVAQRLASAHAPTVRLLAPTSRLRGRTVRVRWAMADADSDPLRATVLTSADGGATWTVRAMSFAATSAVLPARFFPRSARTRVRVVVNDGLREATATSGLLRSDGAAPVVHIDPPPRKREANSAPLYLSGSAFDDSERALTGHALTWRAGKRTRGHGATLSVAGVPATTRSITLAARDRDGRVGHARVHVRLKASVPRILELRARRSGRRVTLRVVASVPARLTITGGRRRVRARVGLKARTVRVPVGAGRHTLHLTLSAGGRRSRVTVKR